MRTRISSGYKITGYLTPVLISHGDLLRMSQLTEETTFSFILDFNQVKVKEKEDTSGGLKQEELEPFVYFQSALLYTHRDGTRRVRIHNYVLPTTKRISEVHESIDCEMLSTIYMKILIEKIFKTKKIVNSIISVENQLKSLMSSVFSTLHSHTKELPNNLEYIPLYFCGLLKNRIACKDEINLKLDIDISNYLRIKLQRMSVEDVNYFLYPKFFQIHHLLFDESLGQKDENGVISLPEIVSNSTRALENDGIYLIDNGFNLILYVKLNCDQRLVKALFGVDGLNEIKSAIKESDLVRDDSISIRLRNIIEYLKESKTFVQSFLAVFETTDSERL